MAVKEANPKPPEPAAATLRRLARAAAEHPGADPAVREWLQKMRHAAEAKVAAAARTRARRSS